MKSPSDDSQQEQQHLLWQHRQKWLNMCGAIAVFFVVLTIGEQFVTQFIQGNASLLYTFSKGIAFVFWVIILYYYIKLLVYTRKH